MTKVNVKPLADRVLIKPKEAEEKTQSGIIIPDTAKEKPMEIEGKSKEEVEDFIEKLKIDKSKLTLDKVSEIYKKYGIDIHDYKELKFDSLIC